MTAVTCVALARLKASIQKRSSTRLSLTGYSVPCTMKTSRPRTFSRTRTKTFPSLKTFVSERASSVPSFLQIARARSWLALPAKILSSPKGSVCFAEVWLDSLQATSDRSMPGGPVLWPNGGDIADTGGQHGRSPFLDSPKPGTFLPARRSPRCL